MKSSKNTNRYPDNRSIEKDAHNELNLNSSVISVVKSNVKKLFSDSENIALFNDISSSLQIDSSIPKYMKNNIDAIRNLKGDGDKAANRKLFKKSAVFICSGGATMMANMEKYAMPDKCEAFFNNKIEEVRRYEKNKDSGRDTVIGYLEEEKAQMLTDIQRIGDTREYLARIRAASHSLANALNLLSGTSVKQSAQVLNQIKSAINELDKIVKDPKFEEISRLTERNTVRMRKASIITDRICSDSKIIHTARAIEKAKKSAIDEADQHIELIDDRLNQLQRLNEFNSSSYNLETIDKTRNYNAVSREAEKCKESLRVQSAKTKSSLSQMEANLISLLEHEAAGDIAYSLKKSLSGERKDICSHEEKSHIAGSKSLKALIEEESEKLCSVDNPELQHVSGKVAQLHEDIDKAVRIAHEKSKEEIDLSSMRPEIRMFTADPKNRQSEPETKNGKRTLQRIRNAGESFRGLFNKSDKKSRGEPVYAKDYRDKYQGKGSEQSFSEQYHLQYAKNDSRTRRL